MIQFFSEDIVFELPSPTVIESWLNTVIESEDHRPGDLNYIFCSDQFLLELNQKYLQHQHLTDILTFDQSDTPQIVSGDIYISIERVQENAGLYNVSTEQELKRVMVHGILHLMGYNDKTPEQQAEMRKKEEAYLSL